jgi:hypothetical protein
VHPSVTSPPATRASHSVSPSASTSRSKQAILTPSPGSPGAPR